MLNEEHDCDNVVEFKIPIGGSKEMYLAKNFSPQFVYANRFQCATVPAYYHGHPNNAIDNRREEEFTISDQAALTKRGINNALIAHRLIEEGNLIHDKHSFQIPMSANDKAAYYYFGDCYNCGSTNTGLMAQEMTQGYFGPI